MQEIFFVLETVGVIAFAIAAIDKETDVFGVLFLSLTTCFGGGMIRGFVFNDISMVREADIGCAVANAIPALRRVADRILPSAEQHPFVELIASL